MPDFLTRAQQPEIMDDLGISGEVVPKTLRELDIINKFLGGNDITLSGLRELISNNNNPADKELHIADMGCGGGEMLKLIADWSLSKNLNVRLTGIDANPNIIEYAKWNTRDYPNIQFHTRNVFNKNHSNDKYDIITATLFLHHFNEDKSSALLSEWKRDTKLGVIINDIHRHPFAYYSIKLLTRTFSGSFMVKNDAPLSVLKAFKKRELIRILKLAGIEEYSLNWKWAFRWKLVIYGDNSSGIN